MIGILRSCKSFLASGSSSWSTYSVISLMARLNLYDWSRPRRSKIWPFSPFNTSLKLWGQNILGGPSLFCLRGSFSFNVIPGVSHLLFWSNSVKHGFSSCWSTRIRSRSGFVLAHLERSRLVYVSLHCHDLLVVSGTHLLPHSPHGYSFVSTLSSWCRRLTRSF